VYAPGSIRSTRGEVSIIAGARGGGDGEPATVSEWAGQGSGIEQAAGSIVQVGCTRDRTTPRRRCSRSLDRTQSRRWPAGTARRRALDDVPPEPDQVTGLGHQVVENDTFTSILPSPGSASGVIAAPPPTRDRARSRPSGSDALHKSG
jgi:hypothetical protein